MRTMWILSVVLFVAAIVAVYPCRGQITVDVNDPKQATIYVYTGNLKPGNSATITFFSNSAWSIFPSHLYGASTPCDKPMKYDVKKGKPQTCKIDITRTPTGCYGYGSSRIPGDFQPRGCNQCQIVVKPAPGGPDCLTMKQ